MQRIRYWLLAARPKTLTAAIVPIIATTGLIKALGYPVYWWISILALVASLCIQVGTNFVNDAMDFKKGADTETRLGPKRVTQSGIFSYSQVLQMGFLFFVLAFAFGIPLVLHGGLPIVFIGLISIFCGYAYTAGPFPLAYKGLGDIFVILFFGVISVGGLFYLQTGSYSFAAFVLGLQVGLHCTVLIAINNLRDIAGDSLVNKKTLPVRFGKNFARLEIALLCVLPFVLSIYWLQLGFKFAAILSCLSLPLAVKLVQNIYRHDPGEIYNQFLAKAAGLHLSFGLLTAIGFIL